MNNRDHNRPQFQDDAHYSIFGQKISTPRLEDQVRRSCTSHINRIGINSLPTEILLWIFHLLFAAATHRPYPINHFIYHIQHPHTCNCDKEWKNEDFLSSYLTLFPYACAKVCVHWRSVLSLEPMFWTRVIVSRGSDDYTPPGDFRDYLRWSRHLPIEVYVGSIQHSRYSPNERLLVEEYTNILFPHVHRCTIIDYDVTFSTSLPCLITQLHGITPDLQVLKLKSAAIYDEAIPHSASITRRKLPDREAFLLGNSLRLLPTVYDLILNGRNFILASKYIPSLIRNASVLTVQNYRPYPSLHPEVGALGFTTQDAMQVLNGATRITLSNLAFSHPFSIPERADDETISEDDSEDGEEEEDSDIAQDDVHTEGQNNERNSAPTNRDDDASELEEEGGQSEGSDEGLDEDATGFAFMDSLRLVNITSAELLESVLRVSLTASPVRQIILEACDLQHIPKIDINWEGGESPLIALINMKGRDISAVLSQWDECGQLVIKDCPQFTDEVLESRGSFIPRRLMDSVSISIYNCNDFSISALKRWISDRSQVCQDMLERDPFKAGVHISLRVEGSMRSISESDLLWFNELPRMVNFQWNMSPEVATAHETDAWNDDSDESMDGSSSSETVPQQDLVEELEEPYSPRGLLVDWEVDHNIIDNVSQGPEVDVLLPTWETPQSTQPFDTTTLLQTLPSNVMDRYDLDAEMQAYLW